MTRRQALDDVRVSAVPVQTPRLRLKPKGPQSGYVDGAWWPHSADLTAELPDLLAVLSVRLGPISRVLYSLRGEWTVAPRKVIIGGRAVRLDGYRRQPVSTVEVHGVNRSSMVLLVVPPGAASDDAHDTLMAAAGPGNASAVESLLAIKHPVPA